MDLVNKILFSDRTPKLIRQSLDFNTQKAAVITTNIANSETPGYKAVRIKFDKLLQQAATGNNLPLKTTNPKHIDVSSNGMKTSEPVMEIDLSEGRLDGNNVNMEKEMTSLTETQMAYEAAISAMLKRGGIIKSAITESR
ncbi:MAG: flagellar basal body rod protein FlgB [Nitrospinota bacterium]